MTTIYVVVAAIFISALIVSLQKGYGTGAAILSALLVTAGILAIIALLYLSWWRLFTPVGREAEKEAQARCEIKKLDRKRDREWRAMD